MEFKKIERAATCRGCGLKINRGDDVYADYPLMNGCRRIIYCIGCINLIGEMYCDWQMYGEDK